MRIRGYALPLCRLIQVILPRFRIGVPMNRKLSPLATAIVLANNSTVNAGQIARDLLAVYYGQPHTQPGTPSATTGR